MARHINSENELFNKVIEMLPAGVPDWAIESVEIDNICGWNGYWVYLNDGWTCEMGCHTIHEDTLKDLKGQIRSIELWTDDEYLTNHKGYTQGDPEYYERYWGFVEYSKRRNG